MPIDLAFCSVKPLVVQLVHVHVLQSIQEDKFSPAVCFAHSSTLAVWHILNFLFNSVIIILIHVQSYSFRAGPQDLSLSTRQVRAVQQQRRS